MQLNDGSQAKAYWLKEELLVPVRRKHIDTVIDTPELFSLTKEYIETVYQLYDEPLHLEGKARREIMNALFKQGWLRIRDNTRVKSYQAWIIEADSKVRNVWISGFAEWALKNEYMSKNDILRVTYSDGSKGFDGRPEDFYHKCA